MSETPPQKKLFFAHPRGTYNSKAEQIALDYIKLLFPHHEIITQTALCPTQGQQAKEGNTAITPPMLIVWSLCRLVTGRSTALRRAKYHPRFEKMAKFTSSMFGMMAYLRACAAT